MATKPKTKKKAPAKVAAKAPAKKTGKSNQHCRKCGKPGHNARRHKKTDVKKPIAPKKPTKK